MSSMRRQRGRVVALLVLEQRVGGEEIGEGARAVEVGEHDVDQDGRSEIERRLVARLAPPLLELRQRGRKIAEGLLDGLALFGAKREGEVHVRKLLAGGARVLLDRGAGGAKSAGNMGSPAACSAATRVARPRPPVKIQRLWRDRRRRGMSASAMRMRRPQRRRRAGGLGSGLMSVMVKPPVCFQSC
jgi:hypothetical protein